MTNLVVGIDPGLSGACALIGQSGLIAVADMPIMAKGAGAGRVKNEVNAAALNQLLRDWINGSNDDVICVVERVSSMPNQGVAGVYSLGDTCGVIRGVIAARGYPLTYVTPQRWKKYYGIASDKELARAKAIQLYPACADLARKKDHNRAEAILLSRWGWETLR
jgi:crossover junction endodeoxyribonuclease RuvC